LSENAEYHQAREDQGKLEARIKTIEHILQNSKIVIPQGGEFVSVGSKVTVKKLNTKEEISYTLVGHQEANIAEGKISNKSPFGQALFGKKKGDKVSFTTPKGVTDYQIISVS
jgi:transcription elongation factor GreA